MKNRIKIKDPCKLRKIVCAEVFYMANQFKKVVTFYSNCFKS